MQSCYPLLSASTTTTTILRQNIYDFQSWPTLVEDSSYGLCVIIIVILIDNATTQQRLWRQKQIANYNVIYEFIQKSVAEIIVMKVYKETSFSLSHKTIYLIPSTYSIKQCFNLYFISFGNRDNGGVER